MVQAIWNDVIIAESDETIVVEGNHYFPASAVNQDLLADNSSHTICPWKGVASYYDIVVDGKTNSGAAWYYPQPKDAASEIKDYVAFWKGVEVKA
ncbi:MAG: DUF427 domain-containing protein [Phototrophicaceae bacterium]